MSSQLSGKIIILNGPPSSGKDVIATQISKIFGAKKWEFKDRIHKIAMAITGLNPREYFSVYNNREFKETALPQFMGRSPRDLAILISEGICKPNFGEDYFGLAASQHVNVSCGTVFSDGGFPIEVNALADRFPESEVIIVRLIREGCDFSGDSRNYINPRDVAGHKIPVRFIKYKNTESIEYAARKIVEKVISSGG